MLLPNLTHRMSSRERHWDEIWRISSLIEAITQNGICGTEIRIEYPLRYCMDFINEDGHTDCSRCPLHDTMIESYSGSKKGKSCIHNDVEEVFNNSGIKIDESMAIMCVMNNSEHAFKSSLMWLSWLGCIIAKMYLNTLKQLDLLDDSHRQDLARLLASLSKVA